MNILSYIEVNQIVKVENLLSTGDLRERMLSLGFTQGALVKVIRKGPNNNLTVYKIQDYRVVLRREESDLILVSYIEV